LVDEPGWWDAPREAIEIGEPVNADDPTTWWSAMREVIELGEPLDANFPDDWVSQKSPPETPEIGTPLDADSPWHEQPEALHRPIDIGPAFDAMRFEPNLVLNDTEDQRNR
jgi:hypothetical protein